MKKLLIISILFCSLLSFGQTKYRVINNEIVYSGKIPTVFERNGATVYGYNNISDSIHYVDGWRDGVMPQYNPETQRLGQRYYNQAMQKVTWVVVDKTPEELTAEKEAELNAKDENFDIPAVKRMLQRTIEQAVDFDSLSVQEYKDLTTIYFPYRTGVAYKAGEVIVVNDTLLYQVIQSHTSQEDWNPAVEQSLYVLFTPPGVVAEWRQRTGAALGDGKYDAYMIGDRVLWNGHIYESKININTWSPEQYPAGWQSIE